MKNSTAKTRRREENKNDSSSRFRAFAVNEAALKGREIIVAVCGGIAAYKVADVVSKLVQRGAGVTVAMTDAAQKFVAPLTFEALSGRKVRTSTWELVDSGDTQHIKLTARADPMR